MSKHTVELEKGTLVKLHLAANAYRQHHEEVNGMDMEDMLINQAVEDFFFKNADYILPLKAEKSL